MKTSNKYKGDLGESIAEIYLSSTGYNILEKNFRCRTGEIDLIGKDGEFLCFIEVKARESKKYGLPCESVNYRKRNKIYNTAKLYIAKNRLYNYSFRFDIVEIMLNTDCNTHIIKLIKNAFHL